jgi:hypothetical protein
MCSGTSVWYQQQYLTAASAIDMDQQDYKDSWNPLGE